MPGGIIKININMFLFYRAKSLQLQWSNAVRLSTVSWNTASCIPLNKGETATFLRNGNESTNQAYLKYINEHGKYSFSSISYLLFTYKFRFMKYYYICQIQNLFIKKYRFTKKYKFHDYILCGLVLSQ